MESSQQNVIQERLTSPNQQIQLQSKVEYKKQLTFSQYLDKSGKLQQTMGQSKRKALQKSERSIFDSLQKIFVDSGFKTVTKQLAFSPNSLMGGNSQSPEQKNPLVKSPNLGSLSKIKVISLEKPKKQVVKPKKQRRKRKKNRFKKTIKAFMLR